MLLPTFMRNTSEENRRLLDSSLLLANLSGTLQSDLIELHFRLAAVVNESDPKIKSKAKHL